MRKFNFLSLHLSLMYVYIYFLFLGRRISDRYQLPACGLRSLSDKKPFSRLQFIRNQLPSYYGRGCKFGLKVELRFLSR